jgi:hypothetical protein
MESIFTTSFDSIRVYPRDLREKLKFLTKFLHHPLSPRFNLHPHHRLA